MLPIHISPAICVKSYREIYHWFYSTSDEHILLGISSDELAKLEFDNDTLTEFQDFGDIGEFIRIATKCEALLLFLLRRIFVDRLDLALNICADKGEDKDDDTHRSIDIFIKFHAHINQCLRSNCQECDDVVDSTTLMLLIQDCAKRLHSDFKGVTDTRQQAQDFLDIWKLKRERLY